MIEKIDAASKLNVKEKFLKRFCTEDVFNKPNTLEGWICLKPDYTYGALCIDTVNHKEVERVINGMPKLHYPFRTNQKGERIYEWPENVSEVVIAEKWDGTNIVHYMYEDANGEKYYTYKTRLTPVARNSALFGNFAELVNEALIKSRIDMPTFRYNFAYELCGYKNPHLVKYDFPITLKPLCVIDNWSNGALIPMSGEKLSFNTKTKITELYTEQQNKDNQLILDSGQEESDFPVEGKVFYVYSEETAYTVVKCKPEVIENIHFARGGIPTNAVKATCYKALEAYPIEQITVAVVNELLEEDYHKEAVRCSEDKVKREIDLLITEATRRKKIHALMLEYKWNQPPYLKAELMRFLSNFFNKKDMRQVFNSAKAMGFIKVEGE